MKQKNSLVGAVALVFSAGAMAATQADNANPAVGFVLDGSYKQGETVLPNKEQGLGLGHTELNLGSPVDDLFYGQLTAVLESSDGETHVLLEEAYLQTTGLPAGMSLRAGRFFSQVGYLNSHLHADDFSERPAVYRALLGSHYFDDGVRFNVLFPTSWFWRAGIEVFNGRQLSGVVHDDTVGIYTISTKFGGDVGEEHSWQSGLAYLQNRLVDQEAHDDEEGEEGDEHAEAEHESHGARYVGKNVYLADLVWKWAPHGNPRENQWVFASEYLYADELNELASSGDTHSGWYVSVLKRWSSQWAVGVRYGEADLKQAHDDHFEGQRIDEAHLSVSWSHSHFSLVRMTLTRQDVEGFDEPDNGVTLQYVMTLGAHAAHDF
jgi:hypothetical protein